MKKNKQTQSDLEQDKEPKMVRRSHGMVTLSEVAQLAGVTNMTVSRVLNQAHLVSPATRERVLEAVRETGYAPNRQAGVLASGRSNLVAVFIPSIANSIFAQTIQGLSDALSAARLEMMLLVTNFDLQREEDLLRAVMGWRPLAIAVTGSKRNQAAKRMLDQAQAKHCPIVQMWESSQEGNEATLSVGFNHFQAGEKMAAILVERGYTHLIFVSPYVQTDFRAHERARGFVAYAQRMGVTVRVHVAPNTEAMEAGRTAMAEIAPSLQAGFGSTAIAFANDNLAAGAMLYTMHTGLRVPQEVGLLGFGDFELAQHLGAGLTTLAAPRYAIGFVSGLKILQALQLPIPQDTPFHLASDLSPHFIQRSTV